MHGLCFLGCSLFLSLCFYFLMHTLCMQLSYICYSPTLLMQQLYTYHMHGPLTSTAADVPLFPWYFSSLEFHLDKVANNIRQVFSLFFLRLLKSNSSLDKQEYSRKWKLAFGQVNKVEPTPTAPPTYLYCLTRHESL